MTCLTWSILALTVQMKQERALQGFLLDCLHGTNAFKYKCHIHCSVFTPQRSFSLRMTESLLSQSGDSEGEYHQWLIGHGAAVFPFSIELILQMQQQPFIRAVEMLGFLTAHGFCLISKTLHLCLKCCCLSPVQGVKRVQTLMSQGISSWCTTFLEN